MGIRPVVRATARGALPGNHCLHELSACPGAHGTSPAVDHYRLIFVREFVQMIGDFIEGNIEIRAGNFPAMWGYYNGYASNRKITKTLGRSRETSALFSPQTRPALNENPEESVQFASEAGQAVQRPTAPGICSGTHAGRIEARPGGRKSRQKADGDEHPSPRFSYARQDFCANLPHPDHSRKTLIFPGSNFQAGCRIEMDDKTEDS